MYSPEGGETNGNTKRPHDTDELCKYPAARLLFQPGRAVQRSGSEPGGAGRAAGDGGFSL